MSRWPDLSVAYADEDVTRLLAEVHRRSDRHRRHRQRAAQSATCVAVAMVVWLSASPRATGDVRAAAPTATAATAATAPSATSASDPTTSAPTASDPTATDATTAPPEV